MWQICFHSISNNLNYYFRHIDEKKPIIITRPPIFNYKAVLSIPYAHVIEDDKIPMNPSNVNELSTSGAFVVFNSSVYDEKKYESAGFSFDDVAVSPPVVIATTTPDGQILVERVFTIEHVRAVNPLKMIAEARPFDEFAADSGSNNPADGSNNDSKTD